MKLHLIARDTLADSSGSDDDDEAQSSQALVTDPGAAPQPHLQPGADPPVRGAQGSGRTSAHLDLSVADQPNKDIASLPDARAKLRITAALRQSRRILMDHDAVPRAPTPDSSSVPDTPKSDSCPWSEGKPVTDGGMQRRSSLLRTALHAAAACGSGQAGARRA